MLAKDIRERANSVLLIKYDGSGLISYKEISSINIKKFMEGKGYYYNSRELWNIAKEKYSMNLNREFEMIEKNSGIKRRDIEEIYFEEFRVPFYEASICEGIITWGTTYSDNFNICIVTDDEDRNHKFDIRAIDKRNQIAIHLQVKKYNPNRSEKDLKKINFNQNKARKYIGTFPELIEVDFSEDDRLKRRVIWKDKTGYEHIISFPKSYGKTEDFRQKFGKILEMISDQIYEEVSREKLKEKELEEENLIKTLSF